MILNYFFATPVGLTILVINIPLFVLGIKTLGRTCGFLEMRLPCI